MAALSTLQDDFSSTNTTKWSFSTGATVSGGALRIVPGSTYAYAFSNASYDLTGSYALLQAVQTPSVGTGTIEMYLALVSGSNELDILWVNGNLYFRESVAGVHNDTSVVFNPLLHKWWRIRENSGTIYWETSPNCFNWTVQRSKTFAIPSITALAVNLTSGYYGTETTPGTALYDNFNVPNATFPQQTYYVSAGGLDTNDGLSTGTPWQSLGRLYQQGIRAGDHVLLRGGDTFTGIIFVDAQNASSSAPTTIDSYGTGAATIYNYSSDGIFFQNSGGIVIQNVRITSDNPNFITNNGIDIYGTTTAVLTYVRIDNVTVSGFENGIAIGNQAGGTFGDIRITNSVATNNWNIGIITYGSAFNASSPVYVNSSVYIGYCKAYGNLGNPNNTMTNSGNGILLGSVNGGTIEYCSAYGNGSLCTAPEGAAAIWTYDSTNITIQHNTAYSNRTGGTTDGDGFDLDINVSNSVVQYNIAYDNDGAGILVYTGQNNTAHGNNVVRYNLCWGNARKNSWYAEIKVAGMMHDTQIYNNTLVATDAGAYQPPVLSLETGLQSVTIRNNALFAAAGGAAVIANAALATSNVLLQGNAYTSPGGLIISWNGTNYASLASWRAGQAQELVGGVASGFEADAKLVSYGTMPAVTDPANTTAASSMKVRPGSALAVTGLDLNTRFGVSPGTLDYFGTTLRSPGSVGAVQAGLYDAPGWSVGTVISMD